MNIGFTGTRDGMTNRQKMMFTAVLSLQFMNEKIYFHHGDCMGADEEADNIVTYQLLETPTRGQIHIHPPDKTTYQAHCHTVNSPFNRLDQSKPSNRRMVVWWEERPYLERNREIVDEIDILVAAPSSTTEELRSGTWSTVRYARKKKKTIIIIYP